jgi:hypothetical protein
MQYDGIRMTAQIVGGPGIELRAAQCHHELIGRRADRSMETLEVVIDPRDVLCGQVIAQDGLGQSTLASPEVEQT